MAARWSSLAALLSLTLLTGCRGATSPEAAVERTAFDAYLPASSTIELQAGVDSATLSLPGSRSLAPDLLGGLEARLVVGRVRTSVIGAGRPGMVRLSFELMLRNGAPGGPLVGLGGPGESADLVIVPLEVWAPPLPSGAVGDGTTIGVALPNRGRILFGDGWAAPPRAFFHPLETCPVVTVLCRPWIRVPAPLAPGASTAPVRLSLDLAPRVRVVRLRLVVLGRVGLPVRAAARGSAGSPAGGSRP